MLQGFFSQQISEILEKTRFDDVETRKQKFEELGIPPYFSSDLGKIQLSADLEEINRDGIKSNFYDFDEQCKLGQNSRCQAGHALSHLNKLIAGNQINTARLEDHPFARNVFSTVLIVDKTYLDLPDNPPHGKITLKSILCRDALELSKFGAPPLTKLCNSFFYSQERVPYTNIYGSGCFIAPDKIMTAAHVVRSILEDKIEPADLIFIRAHKAYRTGQQIELDADQLFILNQSAVYEPDQTHFGQINGDIAWLKVKPYYATQPFTPSFNGIADHLINAGEPVYALGHGLGVPMKLSFKGTITGIDPQTPNTFYCDMNILPGSSGSPVFHAETHQLLGIVSGLHDIHAAYVENGDCVNLQINMEGPLSGVITRVAPLFNTIQK